MAEQFMCRESKLVVTLTLAAICCGLPGSGFAAGESRGSGPPVESRADAARAEFVFDARAAEHLFNRAGFGIGPLGVERVLRAGQEKAVERLLRGGRGRLRQRPEEKADPFFIEFYRRDEEIQSSGTDDEKREDRNRVNRLDRRQMEDYAGWWLERMVAGDDLLRDRLTLFWHGLFTCSSRDVRQSFAVLSMHEFIRENAVESYAELLRGIVHEPAILRYLNNDQNRKGKPNENFARELMELFSLGEGSYTEQDVKEAARCLTGYGGDRDGKFRFNRGRHDKDEKTVLGQTGRFDGDDLVEILLEQPACAEYVAGRLITYLEGAAPAPERHMRYAALLRDNDYQLAPFLQTLFLDPAFYRAEVVGTRVQGPVEHIVATCRRLRVDPPGRALNRSAALLGQTLFQPPNVKGWEEGMAWITTSSLMQRGNVAGLFLGTLDFDQLLEDDSAMMSDIASESMSAKAKSGPTSRPVDAMSDAEVSDAEDEGKREAKPASARDSRPKLSREMRAMRQATSQWRPRIHLTARLRRVGAMRDGDIVETLGDMLLGVEIGHETAQVLRQYLAAERAELGIRDGEILSSGQDGERLLRRLAHQILSLPEAQLG